MSPITIIYDILSHNIWYLPFSLCLISVYVIFHIIPACTVLIQMVKETGLNVETLVCFLFSLVPFFGVCLIELNYDHTELHVKLLMYIVLIFIISSIGIIFG